MTLQVVYNLNESNNNQTPAANVRAEQGDPYIQKIKEHEALRRSTNFRNNYWRQQQQKNK